MGRSLLLKWDFIITNNLKRVSTTTNSLSKDSTTTKKTKKRDFTTTNQKDFITTNQRDFTTTNPRDSTTTTRPPKRPKKPTRLKPSTTRPHGKEMNTHPRLWTL